MILVFAGAGSSASVDSKNYPTTIEFFKRLPEDVKNNALYNFIHEFLKAQKKESLIDIEDVLWTIDDFNRTFDATLNPDSIMGWMMSNNMLNNLAAQFGASVSETQSIIKNRESFSDQCLYLRNSINSLVHNLYTHRPDKNQLTNWARFLKDLQSSDPVVEIFTTNYDLVLESTIKKYGIDIEDGIRHHDYETIIDTTVWDSPGTSINGHGRLTKLHGSVNWQRNSDGTIVQSPVYTGDEKKQAVLYPGLKGRPQEEPFIMFHDHLRKTALRADVAIFVGYAFRDPYINEILSDNLPDVRKHVICKDEEPPSLIPFNKDSYTYYDTGFSKTCVDKILTDLNTVVG